MKKSKLAALVAGTALAAFTIGCGDTANGNGNAAPATNAPANRPATNVAATPAPTPAPTPAGNMAPTNRPMANVSPAR